MVFSTTILYSARWRSKPLWTVVSRNRSFVLSDYSSFPLQAFPSRITAPPLLPEVKEYARGNSNKSAGGCLPRADASSQDERTFRICVASMPVRGPSVRRRYRRDPINDQDASEKARLYSYRASRPDRYHCSPCRQPL